MLKLFFKSLYDNTHEPFDLMVFDNGSCEEVKNYLIGLQQEGKIQYLIFSSQNLKKLGALNYLLSAAPGEYIAFADSDVYFLPGWLEESLKIMETFPEAGQITALPLANSLGSRYSGTLFGIEQSSTVSVEHGSNLISEDFLFAHATSIGIEWDKYTQRLAGRKDILVKRNSVGAFVSAADFQFLTTSKALRDVLPINNVRQEEYFDPIYSPVFEIRLNQKGYWRLSTVDYLVHHMGNKIPDLQSELFWLSSDSISCQNKKFVPHKSNAWLAYLKGNRFVRSLFKKLNLMTYRFLYE
ncbi:MAG: glycosyltransferase family A protein [Desulfobacterales bacterium]|nr:glycosyltransferase family A protein [Desulfobacterales bacterium]